MDDYDDLRAIENQGSREVYVAAQGGETWVALQDSNQIIETLYEEGEEVSMDGQRNEGASGEDETGSNDGIHSVDPNSQLKQL